MDEDLSKTFSPSKLDTYRNCPRQYKFRYIDRISRKTQTVEAHLGTSVHTAMEALYEGLSHGKTLTEAETLAVYEKAWEDGLKDGPLVFHDSKYTLTDWKNLGQECVTNYYRQYHPFDQDRTVAVERKIGFQLPVDEPDFGKHETYRIEGYVDRLAAAPDGAFEVHDYKTGRTLPTQEYLDREDWQLPIYNIAVLENWPDTPAVRLRWHYVRSGKTLTSTRSPEALRSLRGEIAGLIRTIKRDREFQPVKSALCDWCDYRDICPLWKHPEATAKLPEAERRRESGVVLVDQYAEIERRKKALRGEISVLESEEDDLKERLLAYAEEQEIMSVAGSDAVADIHEKEEFHFPTRTQDSEKIELIESKLKSTPAWPEASRLDSRALMDGFQKKRWPAEVMTLIKGWIDTLIKHERVKTVRLHKKKEPKEE